MKRFLFAVIVISIAILSFYCNKRPEIMQAGVSSVPFGMLANSAAVTLFTLKNAKGMQASIIDYGATVVSLTAPDRNGVYADVVLGYDSVQEYANGTSYFGAIVGRYGNRIGKGTFTLDGKKVQLSINNGENHLHGGPGGFNKVLWKAEQAGTKDEPALKLTYVSKDGEEGYPGTVTLTVTYTLTADNALKVEYSGTTDAPTILNPTQHSYFNLTADPTRTILDHELMIAAAGTTPVDAGLITTGVFAPVAGTPFDFTTATKIGARINDANEQLAFGKGYDHNWVLNDYQKGKVRLVTTLYEAGSGRFMEVYSDQPGMQFYSGNFLDGTANGKHGVKYQLRTGLCLEAQCFPDSPNKPAWPSPVLRPGETYTQTTIYKFSTK